MAVAAAMVDQKGRAENQHAMQAVDQHDLTEVAAAAAVVGRGQDQRLVDRGKGASKGRIFYEQEKEGDEMVIRKGFFKKRKKRKPKKKSKFVLYVYG